MAAGGFVCRDYTPEQVWLGGDDFVWQGGFGQFGRGRAGLYTVGSNWLCLPTGNYICKCGNTRNHSSCAGTQPFLWRSKRQKLLLVSHLVDWLDETHHDIPTHPSPAWWLVGKQLRFIHRTQWAWPTTRASHEPYLGTNNGSNMCFSSWETLWRDTDRNSSVGAALDLLASRFPNVLLHLPESQPNVMKLEECIVWRVLARAFGGGWPCLLWFGSLSTTRHILFLFFWGRSDGVDGWFVSIPVSVVVTV